MLEEHGGEVPRYVIARTILTTRHFVELAIPRNIIWTRLPREVQRIARPDTERC